MRDYKKYWEFLLSDQLMIDIIRKNAFMCLLKYTEMDFTGIVESSNVS